MTATTADADAMPAGMLEPIKRLLTNRLIWLVLLIGLAFLLKISTFGDPNRHVDESFYFLVGQRMHEGLLVYVDVWDRKPLGLFLAYYLIAGISHSVLAYQVIACLLSGLTAFVIARLVARLGAGYGALLSGICYLVMACTFGGNSGQTPDFYNLLIATSALLLIQQSDRLFKGDVGWRCWTAMALCGIALTFKQTTLFEAVLFGLFVLYGLYRSGAPWGRIVKVAAICAVIGATPTLLISGYYWQAGHWDEYWHAMVTSNIVKARANAPLFRITGILLAGVLFFVMAVRGFLVMDLKGNARLFIRAWVVVALLGFLSVPNFYNHYTLPLLVPLSIVVGLLLHQSQRRLLWVTALAVYSIFWHSPLRGDETAASRLSMAAVAHSIREHDGGGGLLVFDGPPYLYALTDKPFLSPLVFPHHFHHAIEHNVSHLDTHAELDRLLAESPGIIVLEENPRNGPINKGSRRRVLEYAGSYCQHFERIDFSEMHNTFPMLVFGDCKR